MSIARNHALKRIAGLIGAGRDEGIEAHFRKLNRPGSEAHIRGELVAKLKQIESLAHHVGKKTQQEIMRQVREWRSKIAKVSDDSK